MSDKFEAARFHPVRCPSLIVSTFISNHLMSVKIYENLLKQQQIPVLDDLLVGSLRHTADLRARLLQVKVVNTVKMRFTPTSTSNSGRRLTRAVSRIVSSPTFAISI